MDLPGYGVMALAALAGIWLSRIGRWRLALILAVLAAILFLNTLVLIALSAGQLAAPIRGSAFLLFLPLACGLPAGVAVGAFIGLVQRMRN